jgi:transcriptional regulator GlxA family with amidase domain
MPDSIRPITDIPSLFAKPPPMPDIVPDIRVGFILSPHFSLLPFASFIESLRHAADEADFSRQIYCHWKIIGPSLAPVTASCGVEITPNEVLPDQSRFDFIVIVGGQLPWSLDHPEETYTYIRQAYQKNVSIIGLCTGSFVLAKAGLLDNRRCAIHIDHRNQLKQLFPKTLPETDQIYINDNEVITCPGGTSALDLAFSLIETHCGKARAVKGLATLLVDNYRASHHMPDRHYGHLTACGNEKVEQAALLMERHIAKPYEIRELAHKLNTSERELNRVFNKHAGEPPSTVWRKMRLTHGHWLLVNTTRAVTSIALECGFSDVSHFCRWFKKTYNESPIEFRNRRRNV